MGCLIIEFLLLIEATLIGIFSFCSPLFSLLQALINPSIVDGDLDTVNDAVLYLLTIFRAIKKAEDAVDAHRTPVSIVLFRCVSLS